MSDMQKEIVNFLVLDDLWKRWQHMRFPLKWGEKYILPPSFTLMPSLKVLLLFSRVILRCSDKYSKAYLEKSKCLLKKAFKRNLKNEVFFFLSYFCSSPFDKGQEEHTFLHRYKALSKWQWMICCIAKGRLTKNQVHLQKGKFKPSSTRS